MFILPAFLLRLRKGASSGVLGVVGMSQRLALALCLAR